MKRHRDGAEPEKTENVQIRICASCPSEEYNRVEAICSELQIGKAFGRKGDFMEDTDGKGWFGKWQNRVLQSLDLLLQPYAQKTVFVSFHLLLITDGTSPHCAKERETVEDFKKILQQERWQTLSKFEVHGQPLSIDELTEELIRSLAVFVCGPCFVIRVRHKHGQQYSPYTLVDSLQCC